MATVINNPSGTTESNGGLGFVIGVILLAIVLLLFFVYGLPLLRGGVTTPQVNIPGTIDVNLNQGANQ